MPVVRGGASVLGLLGVPSGARSRCMPAPQCAPSHIARPRAGVAAPSLASTGTLLHTFSPPALPLFTRLYSTRTQPTHPSARSNAPRPHTCPTPGPAPRPPPGPRNQAQTPPARPAPRQAPGSTFPQPSQSSPSRPPFRARPEGPEAPAACLQTLHLAWELGPAAWRGRESELRSLVAASRAGAHGAGAGTGRGGGEGWAERVFGEIAPLRLPPVLCGRLLFVDRKGNCAP